MWLLTRFAILFYVIILWVTSIAIVLFTMHIIDLSVISQVLDVVYYDTHARFLVAGISIGIICVSITLENLIYGSRRRERTIAFDNPGGPVTVSLAAIEDLIKRLSIQVVEIKEIRPTVLAIRKGLDIDIKLILRSEANIPELTTRLQDLVKRKVEESIGMEGKLNIHIHVIKISLEDIKNRRQISLEEPQIPFHGYRV